MDNAEKMEEPERKVLVGKNGSSAQNGEAMQEPPDKNESGEIKGLGVETNDLQRNVKTEEVSNNENTEKQNEKNREVERTPTLIDGDTGRLNECNKTLNVLDRTLIDGKLEGKGKNQVIMQESSVAQKDVRMGESNSGTQDIKVTEGPRGKNQGNRNQKNRSGGKQEESAINNQSGKDENSAQRAGRPTKFAGKNRGVKHGSGTQSGGAAVVNEASSSGGPISGEKLVEKCDSGACKARADKENRVTDNKLERVTTLHSHSPLRSGATASPTSLSRPPVPTPRAPSPHDPRGHHQNHHHNHNHHPVGGNHACGSLFSSCENEIKTKQLVKCFCAHRNNFEGQPRECGNKIQGHPRLCENNSEGRPRECNNNCKGSPPDCGNNFAGHPRECGGKLKVRSRENENNFEGDPRECGNSCEGRPRECVAERHEARSHFPKEEHMQGPAAAGPHRGCARSGCVMGNDRSKFEVQEETGPRFPEDQNDDYLRSVIVAQEKRLRDLNLKNDEEVMILRKEVTKREYEIIRLRHEIHKLKSVLQQATSFNQDTILPPIDYDQATIQGKSGRQGVSGESCQTGKTSNSIQIRRYEKDFRCKQLIKSAIMGNDFLKNLDPGQIREIVDSMYPQKYKRGSFVIRQGDTGAHLFVSAEGEFEIIKDNKILGRMGRGIAFGELAILYNCTRTASIKVIDDAKVWVLDRRVFQQIMMRTGLQRLEDSLQFLKSVPLLQSLPPNMLAKIADVLQVEFFPAEHYIIREGTHGDTFYIISNGSVRVTKRIPGSNKEEEVRTLKRGEYFGEQALLREECRSASVIALSPGVECLSLDRGPFTQLIGGLSELKEKRYEEEIPAKQKIDAKVTLTSVELEEEFRNIKLEDLIPLSTLGIGGFGRVELVQSKSDKTKVYALKCLKKKHIVDTHQQEHVYNEKHIMMACRNPFISRLYRTFRDSKFVYMLMEPCLGGEVWTILRDRGCFDDNAASFVAACVIEALQYLHSHQIVYRDLKPENLLLDAKGYVKMVDFGFSKRLTYNMKTWTFCGTPEYVAPEVILNKGHDRAVDYWSLGVLIFELLSGCPPFKGPDAMKIYNLILEGIDYVSFPRHVSRTAQTLIKRLCHECPSERIGCQRNGLMDVKKHKWFQGFDWFGLQQKTLQPPIIQEVRNPTDTSNFDFYPQDGKDVPDELSNWDVDF